MKIKDVNISLFTIGFVLAIVAAILKSLPFTVVFSAFMLCCFIDKSGYE